MTKESPTNSSNLKPQVILRIQDEHGIHLVKKWGESLSIEGHTIERATSHNANTPSYFLPVDKEFVAQLFAAEGKEYRT